MIRPICLLLSLILALGISGQEVCNNGLDDDGDGYVDQFDEDCKCTGLYFNDQCTNECSHDIDTDITIKEKWRSAIINYSNRNRAEIPSYIIIDNRIHVLVQNDINRDSIFYQLKILDLPTGDIIDSIYVSDAPLLESRYITSFKENGQMFTVLCHPNRQSDSLAIIINHTQNEIIHVNTEDIIKPDRIEYVKVSDLNQDGIADIYIGNIIMNSEGKILFEGNQDHGCNLLFNQFIQDTCWNGAHSIAGDFTEHPGLELACGSVVYEVNLNNTTDSVGNTSTIVSAPPEVLEGHTSMADFDGDGYMDVVTTRNNYLGDGGIWVWSPRSGELLASYTPRPGSYLRGGYPSIADLDNDCIPEIIRMHEDTLVVLRKEGNRLVEMWNVPRHDQSGVTLSTPFDLNGDGAVELLARDEDNLYIYEGMTGNVIQSIECRSWTWWEQPLVSDVDNDGHAEIILSGFIFNNGQRENHIFCFESATTPWVPARQIWNQQGYHVTNVNDDGTIPRQQQSMAAYFDTDSCTMATCPQVYNTFGTQATYRTQKGCQTNHAYFSDVSLEVLETICTDTGNVLLVQVRDLIASSIDDLIALSIYDANPQTDNANLLSSHPLDDLSSNCETLVIDIEDIPEGAMIYLSIRDNGSFTTPHIYPLTAIEECSYSNNVDSILIIYPTKVFDLGRDTAFCEGTALTLIAPEGFTNYEWNGVQGSDALLVEQAGPYTVQAMDECGLTYRDSIQVDVIAIDADLPDSIVGCINAEVQLAASGPLDSIQWSSSLALSCDDCFIPQIQLSSEGEVFVTSFRSGCSNADTISIVALPAYIETVSLNICQGDTLIYNGMMLVETGVYVDSMQSTNGCDSIIRVSVSSFESFIDTTSYTLCPNDSILIEGVWLSEAGQYDYRYSSIAGCDSILSYQISAADSYTIVDSITLCEGDSIWYQGTWLGVADTYDFSYQSIVGCDSSYQLVLELSDRYEETRSLVLCEGDSILIAGSFVTTAGTYPELIQGGPGCDSLLTYQVAIEQVEVTSLVDSFCLGDTLEVGDLMISSAGTYYDTIYTGSICYDLTTIQAIALDTSYIEQTYEWCPTEGLIINGQVINGPGRYPFSLQTAEGCDSTVIALVQDIDVPDVPAVEIDCESLEAIAQLSANNSWTITWDNGETGTFTTYPGQGTGEVTLSHESGCEVIYVFDLPLIPRLEGLSILRDTIVNAGDTLTYLLPLYDTEWDIKWSTDLPVDCDTCRAVNIVAEKSSQVTLTLTHISGCTYDYTFEINIRQQQIILADIFTPNGDNVNDQWQYDFSGFDEVEVSIFDRWGDRVYYSQRPSGAWDGRLNGRLVSSGIYVYVIRFGDEVLTGDITVVR